jgi:hypothetical protein
MSGETRVLTWATLLAKWSEFAQSAVFLPRDGEGGRLRDAVPALIGLQAVTHALAELELLPEAERALGLDRAEVLVGRYGAELSRIWEGPPPPDVAEFEAHARAALVAQQARP